MLVKLILMKEIERTNIVIIYTQQQWTEFVLRYNSYIIKIDHRRNYYSYGKFRHLVRNYRNRKIVG